ncbi:hypothetical protein HY090_00595 [Candidatus Kaiserbacteria bacterium]|nr:hypothetical protein [Candidatus Kaiserbacteria bacterium]
MNKNFSLWKLSLVASVISLAINLAIFYFTKPLAPNLLSLSLVTVTFWTFVGTLGATGTYALVRKRATNPMRTFVRIAWTVLSLSFIPDIALFFIPIPGDTNPAVPGVAALMLMHLVVFSIVMSGLTRYADRSPRRL